MTEQLIIHRGLQHNCPENSLQSIAEAIRNGFEWVEIDVQLTKDHDLVLMHDLTLNRTTDKKGRVATKLLKEIKTARLHDGQTVPTLRAALNLAQNKIRLWIHVRNLGVLGIKTAEAVIREVNECRCEKKVVLSAFPKVLDCVKHLNHKKIETSAFSFFAWKLVEKAQACRATYIQPRFMLTSKLIAKAKLNRLRIVTWPIYYLEEANHWLQAGVDLLVTESKSTLVREITKLRKLRTPLVETFKQALASTNRPVRGVKYKRN